MKEVTQDIATEIKSELREVITQVDNVLESTEPLENSFGLSTFHINQQQQQQQNQCHQLTSAEEMKSSDAVSASDVAQYLREFSIEMASEVKSEIREMCATVKDFNEHPRRSSPTDLKGLEMCLKEVMGESVHRRSESVIGNGRGTAKGPVDVKPCRSESFPNRCGSSQGHDSSSGVQQARHTGAISKLSDSTETASRDSGINLCDSELNQSTGSSASGFLTR